MAARRRTPSRRASSDPNAFPTLTYLALTDGSTQVLGCSKQDTQTQNQAASVSCANTVADPVTDALAKFFGTVASGGGGNNGGGNNGGGSNGGGSNGGASNGGGNNGGPISGTVQVLLQRIEMR